MVMLDAQNLLQGAQLLAKQDDGEDDSEEDDEPPIREWF